MSEGYKNTAFMDDRVSPAFDEKPVRGIELVWKGLCVEVPVKKKETKRILSNINGVAHPGELIAIMGSSGAGKTSLLNALSNQNMSGLNKTGSVSINGMDATNNIQDYSAYVQQEDMFYGAMTCREHLRFQANLRAVPNPEQRINQVTEEMGLQSCIDSKIGTPGRGKTISGGERKRLSFATQILAQPPLLFCDEPTSGLDSYLANQVVQSLQKIAASGTTVLCTIHQPASDTFSMFDNLLLLAKGRVCYMGTTANALEYFDKKLDAACPREFNPADHYVKVTSVVPNDFEKSLERITKICDTYEESEIHSAVMKEISQNKGVTDKPQKFESTSFLNQVYWCFWRNLIINYRDPLVLLIKVGVTLFIAVIFGVIYLRVPALPYIGLVQECGSAAASFSADIMDLNGAIFVSITNQSFSNVFAVVSVFPLIVPIWRIEHFAGLYKMPLSFLATNLSELPVQLLIPLAYTGVTYFMFGLTPTVLAFFGFYLISFLIVQCGTSFGYMLSTFSEDQQVINAVAAPLLIPLMIFGGFFLNSDSIPVYFIWLKYLSWFNYANEALLINQWSGLELGCSVCNETTQAQEILEYADCPPSLQLTGETIIKQAGFNDNEFIFCIGLMVALLVFYRAIAFAVLLFKFRASNR